jgi:Mn-dependent DtxR family transcriptional regulator
MTPLTLFRINNRYVPRTTGEIAPISSITIDSAARMLQNLKRLGYLNSEDMGNPHHAVWTLTEAGQAGAQAYVPQQVRRFTGNPQRAKA